VGEVSIGQQEPGFEPRAAAAASRRAVQSAWRKSGRLRANWYAKTRFAGSPAAVMRRSLSAAACARPHRASASPSAASQRPFAAFHAASSARTRIHTWRTFVPSLLAAVVEQRLGLVEAPGFCIAERRSVNQRGQVLLGRPPRLGRRASPAAACARGSRRGPESRGSTGAPSATRRSRRRRGPTTAATSRAENAPWRPAVSPAPRPPAPPASARRSETRTRLAASGRSRSPRQPARPVSCGRRRDNTPPSGDSAAAAIPARSPPPAAPGTSAKARPGHRATGPAACSMASTRSGSEPVSRDRNKLRAGVGSAAGRSNARFRAISSSRARWSYGALLSASSRYPAARACAGSSQRAASS